MRVGNGEISIINPALPMLGSDDFKLKKKNLKNCLEV